MEPALRLGVSVSFGLGHVGARLFSEPAKLTMLLLAYVASGSLGLWFGYSHPGTTLIWMPSGLGLGAFLILGYRVWPLVASAAAVTYLFRLGLDPAVPFLAVGHTGESWLAAYLVNRYASGRHALQNPRNVFRFAGVAVLAAATTGAPFNAIVLSATGGAMWTDYGVIYFTLGFGSLIGMLLITPPVVLYSQGRVRLTSWQIAEASGALVAVAITGLVGFLRFPVELRGVPVELLCMPVLLWPAFRLGRRASSAALLLLAGIAVVGTLAGHGPFVRATPFASLTIVQLFVALSALMTLSLASLASDYQVAESQLRELAVTDPLTGLPNYRRLIDVIEARDRACEAAQPPVLASCFSIWTSSSASMTRWGT